VAPKIVLAALVGVFVKLIEDGLLGNEPNPAATQFSFTPFTALGVAISLFLGFHNNASYGRWWEARILWGTQVIEIRNLIRFLMGSLGEGGEETEDEEKPPQQAATCEPWRRQLVKLAMAQSHAMRAQLRPYSKFDGDVQAEQDRNRFLTEEELTLISKSRNPANAILMQMGKIVGSAHHRGDIDTFSMVQLSKLINGICHIQTACERIHNTPLPLAYSLLVHRTATLYVFLAPFGMVESLGWWTPAFTAILSYTFFGLDEVARQLQEPFLDYPLCIGMSAICRTIEVDVDEALGLPVVPKLQPRNSILM
jgi:putative membrane protein